MKAKRLVLLLPLVAATIACEPSLPGGYTIHYADRGKAWLQNPDGTTAYGGLIKSVHRSEARILLVGRPAAVGGELTPRKPIGDGCYVALLIDAATRRIEQIDMIQAARHQATMVPVASYKRPCPNTPA
jgi:hypothetical protein